MDFIRAIKVKVDESLVSETYKEELVSERTEKPGFFKSLRMTSILVRLMYVQWTVIIFLVGIISCRLVYSTDDNWIFFVVLTLIFCFIFIPITVTISCIDCCKAASAKKEKVQKNTVESKTKNKRRRRKSKLRTLESIYIYIQGLLY